MLLSDSIVECSVLVYINTSFRHGAREWGTMAALIVFSCNSLLQTRSGSCYSLSQALHACKDLNILSVASYKAWRFLVE